MSLVLESQSLPLHVDADGVIRVGEGRLTLATVVEAHEDHLTPEEIAAAFNRQSCDKLSLR